MNTEQQKIEYKSLQKIRTGEKGFKELSTTCVALANAQAVSYTHLTLPTILQV